MSTEIDFGAIWQNFHGLDKNFAAQQQTSNHMTWEKYLSEHFKYLEHVFSTFKEVKCGCENSAKQFFYNMLTVMSDEDFSKVYVKLKSTRFLYFMLHNLVNSKLGKKIYTFKEVIDNV